MRFLLKEASAETRELLRKREVKTPWQAVPILICAAVPIPVFAWVYFCCFSGLRFYRPIWAFILGPYLAFVLSAAASIKARRGLLQSQPSRAPVTVALSLWGALIWGALGGEHNYWWHMASYYKFQDLAAYTNIDPSVDKGQSYMDAGQVYFREFSRVATEHMIAYRSDGLYCAAPILSRPLINQDGHQSVEQEGMVDLPQSGSVDFWAVGVDCCDADTRTFTCGAAGDPRARAGIRLLRDDVRAFFRLAVQQWTARMCPLGDNTAKGLAQAQPLNCPEARHPLFFHWVIDPLLEVDNYYEKATSLYGLQIFLFTMTNVFFVLASFWVLFTLGVN